MMVKLAYLGRSAVRSEAQGQTLSLAPNLAREPVAFDAPLLQPLRFREAMSALHDVVISDLRFKKKDKAGYLEWKQQQEEHRITANATQVRRAAQAAVAAQTVEIPAGFQREYNGRRKRYWQARQGYSDYLRKHDMELWRLLMPCDPIVTVAEDVLFFECFSADESSYGCLTVDRDGGFGLSSGVQSGTTNVDYSWELYNHFQSLRSYRETRFRIDPAGFEVATGSEDYREEKIDLPQGWLRGLLQIQGAMGLPMMRVPVYSILAFLKRHRSERSPRAIRFELADGCEPRIVLEPWDVPIESRGRKYEGPPTEPIRIWGRRRLLSLARLLPLADSFEVYLLGTGLPSFWVARMGEMKLTLGLSGWTSNDWTRGSAIDLVAPPRRPTPEQIERVGAYLKSKRIAKPGEIERFCMLDGADSAATLRHLAQAGQAIADLPGGVFRWRQIMPQALGEAEIGPEHAELAGARQIMASKPVKVESREEGPNGSVILAGKVDGTPVEVLLDAERNTKRGKCVCGYYRKFSLRNGPCRHMIVLRRLLEQQTRPSVGTWDQRMKGWMM